MRLVAGMSRRLVAARDDLKVRTGFRRLHGPARVTLSDDQAGLVCLMKDAAWFAGDFLDHHLSLGVAHVVVVDNGSTDDTVDIARRFENVTVLQNTLPAKIHEVRLRRIAARITFDGGWIMFADSDEMAEIPGDLSQLLRYANAHGYTAVIGQMLDLYAKGAGGTSYEQARGACDHYSLASLTRHTYDDRDGIGFHWFLKDNVCADPSVKLLSGGMRQAVFGETPFLSKHTFVRNVADARIMTHPHCASNVTVADVTILLRHYKLAGDWRARDRATVDGQVWDHAEDARRLAAPDSPIAPPEPRVWKGIEPLYDEGFLYASSDARAAVFSSASKAASPSR